MSDNDQDDPLYRSHFSRVNRFADRSYEDVRGTHAIGRAAIDRARQGRIDNAPPAGGAASHPSFADPVAGAMDPTSPGSPEHS